jgi:hypothetical protein
MASIERALELIPHDRPHEIVASKISPNFFYVKRDKDLVFMTADTALGLESEPVRMFVNSLGKTVADMKADPGAVVSVSFNHLDNHKTLQITVIEKPGFRASTAAAPTTFARSSFYSNINGKTSFGESYSGPSSAFMAADVAAQITRQLQAHGREHFSIEAFVETPEKEFLDEAEAGFMLSVAMFTGTGSAVVTAEGEPPQPVAWTSADIETLLREAQTTKYLREK